MASLRSHVPFALELCNFSKAQPEFIRVAGVVLGFHQRHLICPTGADCQSGDLEEQTRPILLTEVVALQQRMLGLFPFRVLSLTLATYGILTVLVQLGLKGGHERVILVLSVKGPIDTLLGVASTYRSGG